MKIFKVILILIFAALLAGVGIFFFADNTIAEFYAKQAVKQMEQGNTENAISKYEKSLDRAETSNARLALAELYHVQQNYTKTESILMHGIELSPEIPDYYIALCRIYAEQDKLLDAANLLDNISNPTAKSAVDSLRPAAPQISPASGDYSEYLTLDITYSDECACYVSRGEEFPSISSDLYSSPIILEDGENIITAICVDPDGIVSSFTQNTYNVANVIRDIEFTDPAIEATVLNMLGKGEGEVVSSEELWEVTSLTISDAYGAVTTLDDILEFHNLTELKIYSQAALDWSALTVFENLTSLTLSNCDLYTQDLGPIEQLPKLTSLNLSENCIASVTSLSELVNLESLNLSKNSLSDVDGLRNLTSLTALDISQNAISDLSFVSNLTALKALYANDNIIESIEPLAAVTSLETLDISYCSISDLSPLKNNTALKTLLGSNCSISDLSSLSGCTGLQSLYLNYNQISNISPLTSLTGLVTLELEHNLLSSIPDLSGMSSLADVSVARNSISGIIGFVGMPCLQNLDIQYNNVTSIAALSGCPMLKTVNVFGNDVSDADELSWVTVYWG